MKETVIDAHNLSKIYDEIYHGRDKDIEQIVSKLNDNFDLFDVEAILSSPHYYWYHDKNFDSRLIDKEIYKRVLKSINE